MNLSFDMSLAEGYTSNSQRFRRVTEGWMEKNMYCPRCGFTRIKHFPNNCPVADFFCSECGSQYELKSKNGRMINRVADGAYDTMIERILCDSNPDFFFMSYSKQTLRVDGIVVVPKHFFVPQIIEKRKPLKKTARRAGWIGCNILLSEIPIQGRISIISHGIPTNRDYVVQQLNRSKCLEVADVASRGWLLDVLQCINALSNTDFLLRDIYAFENKLAAKHPENNNIQAKIRQQLQILRDRGYLEFLERGHYRKI